MTRILSIEASHAEATLALLDDGQIVDSGLSLPRKAHARELVSSIRDFLQEQGVVLTALDAIVTTRGPGSFTGIRIGLSTALGLGLGADIPVAAYSVFEVLANAAFQKDQEAGHCAVAMDARRGMVYLAVLSRAGLGYVVEPVECSSEEAGEIICHSEGAKRLKNLPQSAYVFGDPSLTLRMTLCGDGVALLESNGIAVDAHFTLPTAAMLAELAATHYPNLPDESSLTPLYIRPPDAKVQTKLLG